MVMRVECPICNSINLLFSVITETNKEGLFINSEINVNKKEDKLRIVACDDCLFVDYDDGSDRSDNIFEICERKANWHLAG